MASTIPSSPRTTEPIAVRGIGARALTTKSPRTDLEATLPVGADPFSGRSRGARIVFGFLGFFLPTLLDELVARLPGPEADKARLRERGPDRLFLYLQGLAGSF